MWQLARPIANRLQSVATTSCIRFRSAAATGSDRGGVNGRAQSDADGQNLGPLPRMTDTAGTGQDAAGGQGPSERDIGVGTGPGATGEVPPYQPSSSASPTHKYPDIIELKDMEPPSIDEM